MIWGYPFRKPPYVVSSIFQAYHWSHLITGFCHQLLRKDDLIFATWATSTANSIA